MNDRNIDRLMEAWVRLGPASAPNRVLEAVRLETRATRQAAGFFSRSIPERWNALHRFMRLGVAAGAVALSIVVVGYLTRHNVAEPPPSSSPPESTLATPSAGQSLEARRLPGMSPNEPAGVYGWQTGASFNGMHWVVGAGDETRTVSMLFASGPGCLGESDGERAPVVVAGYEGVMVEPYEPVMVYGTANGNEITRAYELIAEDRTLCVFVTRDPLTTPAELQETLDILETIKAQPLGTHTIRINFTLPAGWDTG